jgi:hypothetical protein
LQEK